MELTSHRDRLYSWLRRCLIGDGDSRPGIKPLDRYQTGILFPIDRGEFGLDPAGEEADACGDAVDDEEDSDESEQTTLGASPRKRRFVPPSSVGFSFFVRGGQVQFQLIPRAVRYVVEGKQDRKGRVRDDQGRFPDSSIREVLGDDESDVQNFVAPNRRETVPVAREIWGNHSDIWAGGEALAEVYVLWRPLEDGWLVTASLSNIRKPKLPSDHPDRVLERNGIAFFDVSLQCVIDTGEVGPYPGVSYEQLTHEEQELELQYCHHRVYAIGHGAAVNWELREGHVHSIRTEFLPKVEVPSVSAEVGGAGQEALSLSWLAGMETDIAGRCDALDRFAAGYESWVTGVESQLAAFDGKERKAADRIHKRMTVALTRMGDGVRLLRDDSLAMRAFALANRAMLHQMTQADQAAGRAVREDYRWRPFQLAFLLLTLEPTVNEHSDYRDVLDLIWFPTGGGKTEAYLGLMAFLICWRRMKFGATGGGTAVLMRYTLRLLTKDQFRRASRLICALELLRRQDATLGTEPVTLGLWVGAASSPNTFAKAKEVLDEAIDTNSRPPSLLVLDACPWCGSSFSVKENYDAGAEHFHFNCASPDCDFGKDAPGRLPCNVVDAALYESPPTLLLATIDKFARLAWEERAGAFFGVNGKRPPELVIQDELHLIASALGSVAGLYEAGVETVLAMQGVTPKYVASTATIRMADDQVRRLYGREAAVFPPPGLDADDSYFARTVPLSDKPGRLYVGYLAPARDRAHNLAPLAGAVLAAPEVLFGDGQLDSEMLLDAWWTVLVYHGSLKGVGISRNALQDIETFMARFRTEEVERRRSAGDDAEAGQAAAPEWMRVRQLAERITQLTSHMSADENAVTFDRLRHPRTHPEALDLVLATNMVSVGLDVARLAVMVINGQPLTTAEYIQASSRVGRAEVPGLVIANYYRDQARSLSHYESFRAYHESFYRYVEPTSVTPYTYQARLRALHAALVIAMRLGNRKLADNIAAGDFDPSEPATAKIIEELKLRCRRADPDRGDETAWHLDDLARNWADAAQRVRDQRERLVYSGRDSDRRDQRLLYGHDARIQGLWPTLNNMRNVENTSLVKIL